MKLALLFSLAFGLMITTPAEAAKAKPKPKPKHHSSAPLGTCYTDVGSCMVGWIDSTTRAECAAAGGGSWASYAGACEMLRY